MKSIKKKDKKDKKKGLRGITKKILGSRKNKP